MTQKKNDGVKNKKKQYIVGDLILGGPKLRAHDRKVINMADDPKEESGVRELDYFIKNALKYVGETQMINPEIIDTDWVNELKKYAFSKGATAVWLELKKERAKLDRAVEALRQITEFMEDWRGNTLTDREANSKQVRIAFKALKEIEGERDV